MATATYVPIATQTLGSSALSITFSSIPSGYTDLRLRVSATTTSSGGYYWIRFNGDTGTNYSTTDINYYNPASNSNTNQNELLTNAHAGFNTSYPGLLTLDVFSYTGSTYKTSLAINADDNNGTGDLSALVGLWRSTSAITSITILSGYSFSFAAGSTATLWGI